MTIILPLKLEVIRQLSERYGVTARTVYRWQADGVAVADVCEVALHLARLKNPPAAAVQAVKRLLQTELETLKTN